MVEGSLDILWENYAEPRATPKYVLLFARYKGFRSGAQQPKRLVGADALQSYLNEVNFTPEEARNWVKQVTDNRSVSIPNVFFPAVPCGLHYGQQKLTDNHDATAIHDIRGVMGFDRKDFGMKSGIPFIRIADCVEVTFY